MEEKVLDKLFISKQKVKEVIDKVYKSRPNASAEWMDFANQLEKELGSIDRYIITGKTIAEMRDKGKDLYEKGYTLIDEIPFTMVVPKGREEEHNKRCMEKAKKYGLTEIKNYQIWEKI